MFCSISCQFLQICSFSCPFCWMYIFYPFHLCNTIAILIPGSKDTKPPTAFHLNIKSSIRKRLTFCYLHFTCKVSYMTCCRIKHDHSHPMISFHYSSNHKPVARLKYIESHLLTRKDSIHDKKRYQINTKLY
uniref:Uncharacterized protein n=1 Tax=Opuntia streptacantha TaxID=393608 RepID=A0A7C9ERE8_OPUST